METKHHREDYKHPYIRADKHDHSGNPLTYGKHLDPRRFESTSKFDQDAYYDGEPQE